MILHRVQIGMGFSLHQLREGGLVRGILVCGECRNKASPIVVTQVVGVVVGFSQADADFSQRLTKTSEMEGLCVRDHPIKVKDHRFECGHGIVSILWVWLQDINRADYSTGRSADEARICLLSRPLAWGKMGGSELQAKTFLRYPTLYTFVGAYQIHPTAGL